ncbi:MAG: hypothetical protein R2729_07910 [Bryobacteraceae bacterium]
MYGMIWRLTLALSRLLTEPDREAVLGDLEERGLDGSVRGLADVGLLVGAHQCRLLSGWRPWAALFSLFPALGMLFGCAVSLAVITAKYPWPDAHPLTPGQVVNMSLAAALGTVVWSWSVGYGLGWIAGRAFPSVMCLLTLAVLFLSDGGSAGPFRVRLLAVLMGGALIAGPLIAGLRSGLTGPLPGQHAMGLAASTAAALLWIGSTQPSGPSALVELAVGVMFLWPVLAPAALPLCRRLKFRT